MHERSSPALRTAVLSTILLAACTDAPLAPKRGPSQSAHDTNSPTDVQVFVGKRADSVAHVFDAVWARRSRPDYREARHAWRKSNGFPDSIGDPGITAVPFVPNALLTTGDDGTLQPPPPPPPQIISHFEALHFGYGTGYLSVPDGIEANVTFIGDQAEISAVNVTITSTSGSSFSLNGNIAQGPGPLISCTDVVLGSCDNRRLLNAVAVLPSAPTCNASGSGSVGYYVSNLNSSLSISGSSGTQASVTASGSVSASASPCPVAADSSGQQTSDSTTTTPSGSPSGPPPPPSGPNVPTAPPPPVPVVGSTVSFHCERGDIYVNGTLFETKITCYPDESRRPAESSHAF